MGSDKIRLVKRDCVCALEVWCEAFGGSIKDVKKSDTRELNSIIAATPGWTKFANAKYMGCYGTQRGFKRK